MNYQTLIPDLNVGDYIDILITVHVKRLYMNYDNLFMFQLHPRSLKQVFRTGVRLINRIYSSERKKVKKMICSRSKTEVARERKS